MAARVRLDDTFVDTGIDIVNLFAKHFSSVYSTHSLPQKTSSSSHSTNNFISNIKFTEKDVFKRIKKIDSLKGAGPDSISPLFVNRCGSVLALPLTIIFNRSLKEGTFPDEWKKTRIVPVYKKGDEADVKNYRPISILSCFSKLFESLLCPILTSNIDSSISNYQHGFRKGRSIQTNLVPFVAGVCREVDKGSQVDAIYTDFCSAFDKVNHYLLLSKLNKYGIADSLVRWFASYLYKRPQSVVVNGYESNAYIAESGVPQGSHLGPILFLAFINDITEDIKHCKVSLFADDLKIYRSVKSPTDANLIKQDFKAIKTWCDVNCMRLNINKCFHIKFTRKKKPLVTVYEMNGIILKEVEEIRDLGVIMDSRLTFIPHINMTVTKAAQMLGFLKRNSYHFTDHTKTILFNTLVRSHLEYASTSWNPFYVVHSQRIESIQRAFTRHLAFCSSGFPHRQPYTHRLEKYNMTTLRSRRIVLDMTFLHKIIYGDIECSTLLNDISITVPFKYPRQRISQIFHIPYYKTNLGLQSPLVRILNEYNLLNSKIPDLDVFHDTFTKFKKSITNSVK